MGTEFSCAGAQPTLLSAPLALSWTFFFALWAPPKRGDRIQSGSCGPQSLYGTPSRPTVQSSRGSTGVAAPAVKFALLVFHAGSVRASGSPVVASTAKKLTRFCDGWWKPQQPKGLPECGKLRRSP